MPVLAWCDSASEVRFALAFATAPGWRVDGDRAFSNGRYRLELQRTVVGYRVDFALGAVTHDPVVAIEIDGPTHYTPDGRAADRRRQAAIEATGLRVLRLWAGSITELAPRLREILGAQD